MFESRDEAIYELLKLQGLVRLPQLDAVWQEARISGISLADAAIDRGLIDLPGLLAAVAAHLGLGFESQVPAEITDGLMALMPRSLAVDYGVVPLRESALGLEILALDPFAAHLGADLGFALGRDVRVVVGDPRQVGRLLERYYGRASVDRSKTGAPSKGSVHALGAGRESTSGGRAEAGGEARSYGL